MSLLIYCLSASALRSRLYICVPSLFISSSKDCRSDVVIITSFCPDKTSLGSIAAISTNVEAFSKNPDKAVLAFTGSPINSLIESTNLDHALCFLGTKSTLSNNSWNCLFVKPKVKNSERSACLFSFNSLKVFPFGSCNPYVW